MRLPTSHDARKRGVARLVVLPLLVVLPRLAIIPVLAVLPVLAIALAGCTDRTPPVTMAVAPAPTQPASASVTGPVLGADGRCQGPAPGTAAAIELGIAECDLVRLKGKDPTDVLVGESGKGQREVQVLYAEPGGREIYLFVDNRLNRIIK
jgi:hypothetical protein